MRILLTGARTPFALHLTRLLTSAGHEVLLTDSSHHALASASRMKAGYRRTPSARFEYEAYARAIGGLVDEFDPGLVLPSCEEVFYLAHAFAAQGRSELLFAPSFELLAEVHHKARFAHLAQGLGYGPEENQTLTSQAAVKAFSGDPAHFVFKPVWSRFASRVLVGPERHELDDLIPTPERPWLAQSRILGDELCVYAVMHHGRLVAMAPYRGLARAGKGTSIIFEAVEAPDVEAFLVAFAAHTGWHGQISFDVIRETATGRLVAIEANPRATSGVHFFSAADNLPAAIIEGSTATVSDRRTQAIKGMTALFGTLSLVGLAARAPYFSNLISARDAYYYPGDGRVLFGQMGAMSELAEVSRRFKVNMQEAATYDMEWNGLPPGSEHA
jgi:hypothetical protein